MTKRKTLNKPGNYTGTKSYTSKAKLPSDGLKTSSRMGLTTSDDFSDLTQPQLDEIASAFADATELKGLERDMLKLVLSGGGSADRDRMAKNLSDVVRSAPEEVRQKMSAAGVHVGLGERAPVGGTPDAKKKVGEPPARHQELLDMHRAHLLETDPARVKEIGAQLRERIGGMGLSEEEQQKFNEAVIDMWAEEYSEAMQEKEGDAKNHVRERVNKLLSRLDESSAALFTQRLREKMSGGRAEGQNTEYQGADTGSEESAASDRHKELLDLHRAHLLEIDPARAKELGVQLRARLNEMGLTEEEREKLNEAVIDMWAEEYGEAMQQKEGDDKNHIRERVNNLLSRLDEDGVALFTQRLREKMSGSGSNAEVSKNEDHTVAEPKPETPGDVVSRFVNDMRSNQVKVERKYNSKNITAAKKNLQAVIDAHPGLVLKVSVDPIDKAGLSKSEVKKLQEETIAAIDALAQQLETMPEGYAAVLRDIEIKPQKGWKEYATPEEELAARYALLANRPGLAPELQREKIARREINFYRAEVAQKTEAEVRAEIERHTLERLAVQQARGVAKTEDEFKAVYAEKLRELEASAHGERAEDFQRMVDKTLQEPGWQRHLAERNETALENKYQELLHSEAVARMAEDVIQRHLKLNPGAVFASLDDTVNVITNAADMGVYSTTATLKLNPGLGSDSGFDNWSSILNHEIGHLKNLAWADGLFSCLAAMKMGLHVTSANNVADYRGAPEVMNALNSANSPVFDAFLKDWAAVSMYTTGGATINGKTVPVWKVKDKIDKQTAANVMHTAFGYEYAGNEVDNPDGVMIGVGVREELAEAHRLYTHPQRDQYVAALRASGNGNIADYLEGMFGVIKKYDDNVKVGVVAPPYKKMVDRQLAKKAKKTQKNKGAL